jgi:hypothetical protein
LGSFKLIWASAICLTGKCRICNDVLKGIKKKIDKEARFFQEISTVIYVRVKILILSYNFILGRIPAVIRNL